MDLRRRTLALAALLAASGFVLRAQTATDPSGHWSGTFQGPETEIGLEIDLAKNSKGEIVGTINFPNENVKGIPLRVVSVKGRSITFSPRADQSFTGEISADGKTIAGEFKGIGPLGNEFATPFTLTKAGAAKFAPAIKNPAIAKELVGTWHTSLESKSRGTTSRIVLTLANNGDGTSTGKLTAPDEGGMEIPVGITQKGQNVAFDFGTVGASFSGTLNAAGTEIAGTFTQASMSAQVTFRRDTGAADTKQ
jgi:hypothetical protein